MSEQTFAFGRGGNLCGTLTSAQGSPAGVAILLLNAGIIHRIGPHRINVKLARDLAGHGFHCFRFDLSGLGDSRFSAQARSSYQEQAIADIADAMQAVTERTGVSRFAVFGICSGAQNGLAAAAVDARLAGLFMVDGYAYATASSAWHRRWFYLRRAPLTSIARWLLSLRRRLLGTAAAAPSDAVEIDYGQNTPPKPVFAQMLTTLVGRGVRVAALFTGSWIERFSYLRQWHDGFRGETFVDRVEIDFQPELDHTASTLAGQRFLVERVRRWALEHFAGP